MFKSFDDAQKREEQQEKVNNYIDNANWFQIIFMTLFASLIIFPLKVIVFILNFIVRSIAITLVLGLIFSLCMFYFF